MPGQLQQGSIETGNICSTTIDIHFREVMEIAKATTELATRFTALGENTLTQIMCEAKASWQGKGADSLAGREVRIINQLIAETENLKDIADDLANLASRMYQAETRNYTMAGTRLYE